SKRSRPTNITGTDLNPSVISPRKITPLDNFLAVINKTVSQYGEVWHEAFNGEQDLFFKKLGCQSANSIKISAETWAQICFQSIIAFHKLDKNLRADFLKALTAVFYGRLITWLHSGFSLSLPQMESLTEEECAIFESKRSVILERWPELHNQSN
ncbi:MAG: hypothetical protein LBS44_04555, partial [Deltaproteobacteria bacterium]|nr:hypothetical protein [Deltaproteobacteria bacterium]